MKPAEILSPLQLEELVFDSLRLESVADGSMDVEVEINPRVFLAVSKTDARHWRIQLEITVGSAPRTPPFAYAGEVRVTGMVRLHAEYPAEDPERLACVNGASLLYAAIREIVASVTARGRHGLFLMPTLNFQVLTPMPLPAAPRRRKGPVAGKKAVAQGNARL